MASEREALREALAKWQRVHEFWEHRIAVEFVASRYTISTAGPYKPRPPYERLTYSVNNDDYEAFADAREDLLNAWNTLFYSYPPEWDEPDPPPSPEELAGYYPQV